MKNKIFKMIFIIILSIILTLFIGIKKSYCATVLAKWWSGHNINTFSYEVEKEWLNEDILPKMQENFDYEGNRVQEQMKVKTQVVVLEKKLMWAGIKNKLDLYAIRIRRARYKKNILY